jgi:hypothetical protein
MDAASVLDEIYGRLSHLAHQAIDGASLEELLAQPTPDANSIAWLVWHSARVLDDHVSDVMGTDQLWSEGIWPSRFGLPADTANTGYGHTPADLLRVRPASPADLTGYFDEIQQRCAAWIARQSDGDLDRVVDTRWDPPVTLGVRLVSVADDCLQHLGQAAYVRGFLTN